jgi:hypothetical protein
MGSLKTRRLVEGFHILKTMKDITFAACSVSGPHRTCFLVAFGKYAALRSLVAVAVRAGPLGENGDAKLGSWRSVNGASPAFAKRLKLETIKNFISRCKHHIKYYALQEALEQQFQLFGTRIICS